MCIFAGVLREAHRGQRMASDSLKAKTQIGVSCQVGSGNQTWVLWGEKKVATVLTAESSL